MQELCKPQNIIHTLTPFSFSRRAMFHLLFSHFILLIYNGLYCDFFFSLLVFGVFDPGQPGMDVGFLLFHSYGKYVPPLFFFFFYKLVVFFLKICVFIIYLWLCWVFSAAWALFSWGGQELLVVVHGHLVAVASFVGEHKLSRSGAQPFCSASCGIPHQGSNLCPLYW